MYFVYFIWNVDEDTLLYIGRSQDPKDRLRDFIRREGVSAVLGDCFQFDTLEESCRAELRAIADYWPPYNSALVSSPGNTGFSRRASEETKDKIRAAHVGRRNSSAHCENISKGRKGIVFGPEWRMKISAANKGRRPSDETRARLSAAKLGKKRGPYKKHTPA